MTIKCTLQICLSLSLLSPDLPFLLSPATCPMPWLTRYASAARRASPLLSGSSIATESCTMSTASCVPSASGPSLRASSTR